MNDGQTTRRRATVARDSSLRAGAVLGRYVVVRFLGAGGHGEVWAAYDQVLQRTVALKVLLGPREREQDGADLIEEAQCLARLSHPAIVAVHDVARHGPLVFLSMELIDGVDLRSWLVAESRPWKDRLQVLLGAGRGLAAAHAAGVVHGDFKPANVLVDRGGSPRVVDFGLARGDGGTTLDGATAGEGTPSYMAPQQHRGAPPSVASDQYAFAVTTFEALAGQAPFAGDLEADLVAGKDLGLSPSMAAKIPKPIRGILERALASKPSERFESTDALLDALERAARPRSRLVPTLAAAGMLTLGWLGLRGVDRPCEELDAEMEGVWDPARRAAAAKTFANSDQPWAPQVGETTVARLDELTAQWLVARRAVCEQRDDASSDGQAYALRTLCLDAARSTLRSATDLVIDGDDKTIERAVEIVGGVAAPESCLDIEVRVPRAEAVDPDDFPQLEEFQAELGRLQVLRGAGRYEEALSRAEALVADATAAGDLHDAAMAQLEVGDLRRRLDRDGALEALHSAFNRGLASGRKDVVAKSAASLAWQAAGELELPRAKRWLDHAEAAAAGAGRNPRLTVWIENARSQVHGVAGESSAELAAARRALDAMRSSEEPAGESMAVVLNTLAASLAQSGDTDTAAEHARESLEIIERVLGPHHPRWATSAMTVATIAHLQGHRDTAAELMKRAHAVALRSYGPTHPHTLTIAAGLATAHLYAGEYAEAVRLHRQNLQARLQTAGPTTMGTVISRINLGIALHRTGELDEAKEQLEAAHGTLKETVAPDHPYALYARVMLADVRVDLGETATVTPELEALLRDHPRSDPAPVARFALARALRARNPDSQEAVSMAEMARVQISETPGSEASLERIDRWLNETTSAGQIVRDR